MHNNLNQIPGFTAEACLETSDTARYGSKKNRQGQMNSVLPQSIHHNFQFQRCQFVCIPHPDGVGMDCSYLCYPEAALQTHPTDGLH